VFIYDGLSSIQLSVVTVLLMPWVVCWYVYNVGIRWGLSLPTEGETSLPGESLHSITFTENLSVISTIESLRYGR